MAALAGLVVVAFTWLAEQALQCFSHLEAWAWWAPLLWMPACTAAIVWATRRWAPGAAGSGIPQVMASLDALVATNQRESSAPGLGDDTDAVLLELVFTAADDIAALRNS